MNEDLVEIILNGETIRAVKDYDISIAFLQVPNAFAVTVGSGQSALDLMARYPAGTTFALRVNGVVQFMGRTDGWRRRRGEATELEIVGRDALAQLLQDEIQHDRSFSNITFEALTRTAFDGAGYEGITLTVDASAHRAAVTGTPILEPYKVKKTYTSAPVGQQGTETVLVPLTSDASAWDVTTYRTGVTVVSTEVEETRQRVTGYKTEKPIQWKAGQPYYQALNKELSRAGLFLRAGVDPDGEDPNVFLLSEPNAAQPPLFGLVRIPAPVNLPANVVNVSPPMIDDVTVGRHAFYTVRGRTGTGKNGRTQIEYTFTDEDMVARGYRTHRVIVDENCKTQKQAEYMARKACAEARRQSRVFTYTVHGRHSLPLLRDETRRAIPNPDIVVALRDDEHGLYGDFWVERVRFRASANGGTFTDITLMVPDDLVFGEGQFYTASGGKRRKVFGRTV